MREFTSTPAENREPDKEAKFKLDGTEFRCVLRGDADSLLGWSELAASASSDVDVESAEGAAFVHRFFTLMMDPVEYRRFRAHLKTHKTDPDVLSEIMNELDAEMRRATAVSSDRPTVPPSSSSGGRRATDERRLQIVSLQEGDGEVVLAPRPNREARRRAERDQRRAAQGSAVTG